MGCARDLLGHYRLTSTATEEEILRAAEEILALVDIRLLDHFVVGGAREPISMAARGWV